MGKAEMIGRIGLVSGPGGGKLYKAQLVGILPAPAGNRYLIKLIDPPPALVALNGCHLVGKYPEIKVGTLLSVIQHKGNQFVFREKISDTEPAIRPPAATKPKRTDTLPGLSPEFNHPFLDPPPLIGNGMYVKFNALDPGRVLSHNELLFLPDNFLGPGEKLAHEDRVNFVRLNHTIAYADQKGMQLCCSQTYFRIMQNILVKMRTGSRLNSSLSQAEPAQDFPLRSPGLRNIVHANVNAFYVFPEEIKQETGFRLPVIFFLEKDGRLPERVSYKLCFEVEDAATGKVLSFDPLKMGVIDLIHYMLAYDFRSIDIRTE